MRLLGDPGAATTRWGIARAGDLAAALLHDPEVLFLDEPTIGLDVVAKARIRDALRGLVHERGCRCC
jgi:ABC-2 type transport system ATP-binding protein